MSQRKRKKTEWVDNGMRAGMQKPKGARKKGNGVHVFSEAV